VNNTASKYSIQEEYHKALELYRQALEAFDEADPNHVDVAIKRLAYCEAMVNQLYIELKENRA